MENTGTSRNDTGCSNYNRSAIRPEVMVELLNAFKYTAIYARPNLEELEEYNRAIGDIINKWKESTWNKP